MAKSIPFYIFNIKLQSQREKSQRRKEYVRIISELSNARVIHAVGKAEAITMHSALGVSKNKEVEEKYIYGHASKGTYIPGNEITVLKNGEIKTSENDPNQLYEPKTVDYIFLPEIHRLAFQKSSGGPTFSEFEKYLNTYLPKFLRSGDIIEIVLEKDPSVIKEIYSAKIVHSLSYKISYTNDDLTGAFGDEFDEQLKKSKIGEISVVAKADNITEGLNVEDSVILKGGLELAEKNGEIRSATIVREGHNTKKVKISNMSKPQVETFEEDEVESKWVQWSRRLLSIYR